MIGQCFLVTFPQAFCAPGAGAFCSGRGYWVQSQALLFLVRWAQLKTQGNCIISPRVAVKIK